MVSKQYKIISPTGIHSKTVIILVNESNKFKSMISLKHKEKMVDLKSVIGVMSLGIYNGETISIACMGEDEECALQALNKILINLNIGLLSE